MVQVCSDWEGMYFSVLSLASATSLHRIFQEKPLKKELFDHLLSHFFFSPGSDAQGIREAVVLGVSTETNSNATQ